MLGRLEGRPAGGRSSPGGLATLVQGAIVDYAVIGQTRDAQTTGWTYLQSNFTV